MTPLERAARAIWDLNILLTQEECERAARAVLEAIREPSERMAEEAFRNGACGGHLDCWQAMIDAALAEGA